MLSQTNRHVKVVYGAGIVRVHEHCTLTETPAGGLVIHNRDGNFVRGYGPSYHYWEYVKQEG